MIVITGARHQVPWFRVRRRCGLCVPLRERRR